MSGRQDSPLAWQNLPEKPPMTPLPILPEKRSLPPGQVVVGAGPKKIERRE
jgi:hypothetical protein